MRPETIKILEQNTGSNFSDTGHGNFFLDRTPKARETKAKINWIPLGRKYQCGLLLLIAQEVSVLPTLLFWDKSHEGFFP